MSSPSTPLNSEAAAQGGTLGSAPALPRVSVVIPTFNRAHLVPRCLQSLLAQTLSEFEAIVADDGSTDGTEAVVAEWSARDARIRYARHDNQGAGAARNLGAAQARGEYLAFLDSDDEARPAWLETLWQAAQEHQAAIACCGISFADATGTIHSERRPPRTGLSGDVLAGLYRSGTFLLRREAFVAVGGYVPTLAANQHSELRCRLAKLSRQAATPAWRVICLEPSLIIAHDHQGPKIRRNTPAIYDSARYIMEQHGDLLKESTTTYASWATACAGLAAKTGRYGECREWLRAAIAARPKYWKNYLRFALAAIPVVRSAVWRRATTATD